MTLGAVREAGVQFRTAAKTAGTRVGVTLDTSALGKVARVSVPKKFRGTK